MKKNTVISLIAAAGLFLSVASFSACSNNKVNSDWRPNSIAADVSSETLFVEKVEDLPEDFILGMDASCVPSLEAGGVKYYDHDGVEKDVYEIFSENGINYIRVRVWNDPFDAEGNGYGEG